MATGIVCVDQMEKIKMGNIIRMYAAGNVALERRSDTKKNEHMNE